MIEQYVGDSYREDLRGDWSENSMFEFIRLTTGKIVFDNPKFRVKTDRLSAQAAIAEAIQLGLNKWARKSKLRRLLKRVFVNQCFSFAAVQTVIEPQPWMDPRTPTLAYWPQCYLLDSDRFFFDHLCSFYGAARFAGHKYVRDTDDLIDEAENNPDSGWDVDAIKALGKDSGVESLKRGPTSDRHTLTRGECVLYEIWVPEINTQDPAMGFHGTLYTIAASPTGSGDGDVYIREPRPYYGPRCGPYTMFGVYPVPGDPFPLSPFAATRMQGQELNDVTRGVNKAIREYKRLVLCSAENPDLAMKLKKPDNVVLPVKGFTKDQVEQIEIGGVTEQHLKQLEIMLARMDRNSGISQTQRGEVTGATATEIAVSDGASEASVSYVKQEFVDGVVQLGESAGFGLYHDDRVQFPLGEDAGAGLGMVEPWFQGGSHIDPSGASYDDLDLEIEPYSMERLNEALLRAQYAEMMQLAIEAAPLIPATPFYDWKRLFDKGGEVMNDPQFGDFYNPQMAQTAQAMTIASQQIEQEQGVAGAGAERAAMQGQQVSASVEAQKPGLEREKIATQRAGLAQKTATDHMKIKAQSKAKPKGKK